MSLFWKPTRRHWEIMNITNRSCEYLLYLIIVGFVPNASMVKNGMKLMIYRIWTLRLPSLRNQRSDYGNYKVDMVDIGGIPNY